MDWFLYDNGLRHERVKGMSIIHQTKRSNKNGYSYLVLKFLLFYQHRNKIFC